MKAEWDQQCPTCLTHLYTNVSDVKVYKGYFILCPSCYDWTMSLHEAARAYKNQSLFDATQRLEAADGALRAVQQRFQGRKASITELRAAKSEVTEAKKELKAAEAIRTGD